MNHSFDVRRPALILAVGATLAAHGHSIAAGPGRFTPDCARYDLQAYAVIEQRGELAAPPTAWLGNAGLNYLQARVFCLSGEERKGVELYRRIIQGDMSLPAPPMTQ
jgi:hypothetical protein